MHEGIKKFAEYQAKKDHQAARKAAADYIKDHRAEFAALEGLPLETVCSMVSAYRAAGRHEDRLRADMWAQAEFGPQKIVGSMRIGG